MTRGGGLLLVLALACASCSVNTSVRATQSVAPPAEFDREHPLSEVADLPDAAPVEWGPCDEQPSPWECATVTVPLDYRRTGLDLTIDIAVTRLPATSSDRIGSLVMNPGGPGGSGVQLAWGYASAFPDELTSRFDLVGFDPRGVGRSTAVDCGDLDRRQDVVLHDCVRRSGELLPYVGTVNAARDMEMIRRAIGDEALTYLGFSYGTALGAVYADLFPEHVRALVLDGSVDPAAGEYNTADGAIDPFGSPFYGVQDFDATEEVFHDLCDSVRSCAAGPDSRHVLFDLYDTVDTLPVDGFPDWADEVSPYDLDRIVVSAMYNTDLWEPLAVGLADAEHGDASTLAALASFLEAGYPREEDSYDNLGAANIAVYCADFAGRSGAYDVGRCFGFPETTEPLPAITAVDTPNPVVVIGTDGDPATPGFLAPEMASALGDAVSIRWEGAGHTAFLHSECIDELVIGYLVDLTVPKDRSRCTFTGGDADTSVAQAKQVFELDRPGFLGRITKVLEGEGLEPGVARCVAEGIIGAGDDAFIVYARLGVHTSEFDDLRDGLETDCTS